MNPVRFGLIDIQQVKPGRVILDKETIPTHGRPERLKVLADPFHVPSQTFMSSTGKNHDGHWSVLVQPVGAQFESSRFSMGLVDEHLVGSANPIDRYDLEA